MRRGELRDWTLRGIAIALLVVVASTSYWYSMVIRKPRSAPAPAAGTPDFVVEHLSLTQFDATGRARYRLFAQQLMHYSVSDDMTLTEPRLVTLYPDRPQVEVKALQARLENNAERVLMTGAVRVTRAPWPGQGALTLRTEALTAWPDEDRYASEVPTEIEQTAPLRLTQAGQMRFDNVKREIDFQGQVRTVIGARTH